MRLFRPLLACCLLAGLMLGLLQGSASAADRPNILFIFTDDHANHAIGAYDGWLKDVDPTPTIDKLAAEGMLFKQSFCTNSICGPSRAVIQTGKHSHINGFKHNGNNFDASQQTFPKLLQKAGYQTAVLGKWHLKSTPQGFDHWTVLPGQGDYYNPVMITPEGRVTMEGYCTDIVTDMAVDWLKNGRDPDKPFMLMCQHKAPHRNWMPPLRHLDLYSDGDLPQPDTLFDTWDDKASPAHFQELEIDRHMSIVYDLFVTPGDDPEDALRNGDRSGFRNLKRMTDEQAKAWHEGFREENEAFKKANLKGKDLVRWKYQRYIKNYLRCIRGVDDSVKTLMDYLNESGLDKNTIVIYSSDQGFYLGDRGWYDKRWIYEESLQMPLIVKWPGVTKPGSVDNEHLVQNLDYASTFLDIAGAEIPADMQGESLVPLLKGEKPEDWRDAIYYHYFEYPSVHMVAKHYGIRTDRYKLFHFYEFDEWEFYDLQKDPGEQANGYHDPKNAEVIAKLKEDLKKLRTHYADDTDISEKPLDWQRKHRTPDWQGAEKWRGSR
ncbi:MAG: sulfatase [Pirellulaceae bacterium]